MKCWVIQTPYGQLPGNPRKNLTYCFYLHCTATFVLHHPEHGHAVVHPILSHIIDGTLCYDRHGPPFSSFISLFSHTSEVRPLLLWLVPVFFVLTLSFTILYCFSLTIFNAARVLRAVGLGLWRNS